MNRKQNLQEVYVGWTEGALVYDIIPSFQEPSGIFTYIWNALGLVHDALVISPLHVAKMHRHSSETEPALECNYDATRCNTSLEARGN
jgi:hypothetical protein